MDVEINAVNHRGAIPVHISANMEIPLKEKDILRWLDGIGDPALLKRIGKYAGALAKAIEYHADDDFRSRA